jgi:signal transduction histidine kinase
MAGKLNSLAGRMVLVVLAIHAVLLPALFSGVLAVVSNSQKVAFIDASRIYARVFADILESGGPTEDIQTVRNLDSAVLGGRGMYASILIADRTLISSLMGEEEADLFEEDFVFGEHGDDVYYLSIPISLQDSIAVLRLGFDEIPTLHQIEDIEQAVLLILLGYVFISLILVMILSILLVSPIQRLREVSRMIASGDYSRKLQDKTSLYEIQELAHDLEIMRSNLVGVNARLQLEINEREAAEAEQRSLEARLRHSDRLESIGTLAGGVAHEFNNVLAPIMLYTDLALEDLPEDNPVRSKLNLIMDLAKRAKGLSQQILAFGSRSGEQDRSAVDIAPVIEESLSLVRVLVPATVEIQADIKHNLGLVLCDAAQIQQLVVNLCNNAFRSLSRGGGRIQVSVDSQSVDADFAAKNVRLSEGEYVKLTVSDTGTGMDAATVERIFEPFFTTQTVGQGTGLGLSIVHGIVVRHNGDIVVSSTPGKGTTIEVYFPLTGNSSNNKIAGTRSMT